MAAASVCRCGCRASKRGISTRAAVKEIKVDYDYYGDVLALNQAKIAPDYAFFTGIELFLQPEGHRDAPSTVHFKIPTGWKLITALRETNDPMTFTAVNYDTLVDAPTEIGNFDVTEFEVDGKPHYLVANPAGTFSADKAKAFTEMLGEVALADKAIFGELPYEKYVYFYFFASAESNASGAARAFEFFRFIRTAGRVRHAAAPDRHGRARILSPVERQADPSGGNVAIRLLARE